MSRRNCAPSKWIFLLSLSDLRGGGCSWSLRGFGRGNCLFLPISIRQNRQKPVVLPAQIEKWPHGWIFARTNRKLARTERQSARTDRIFVARREKWPHGTISRVWEPIFARTEGLWLPPKASGSCARPIWGLKRLCRDVATPERFT